jgi:two-component system OmpR family sensor kinase
VGLGLAVARQVVALHQGTLDVVDAPGGGACFRIRIPPA